MEATVDATADRIFDYLARPANHATLDTSGMIIGAADDSTITQVGATFVMNMRNDMRGRHEVENHVIRYEYGRAIGWAPAEPGTDPAGHTWTWLMTPRGPRHTLVSEVYDWSEFRNADMVDRLPVISREQMKESLERLANAVRNR
ncbi:hypothetical protein [Mycolicibacterium mageritense]